MKILWKMTRMDLKRRSRDSFIFGYNIIFPVVMILLMGFLTSGNYGKEFTGYHYYTVVMLPFCIAMSVITAAYAGKDDSYKKTAVRYLFAPVSRLQIVLTKIISCSVVISISSLIVIAIAAILFRIPIGRTVVPIAILFTAEAFVTCALGVFIGLGMKNFIVIKNILNIPILAAAILAGVFYPIGTLNQGWELVQKLSPLTWINRGLFLCIYDNSYDLIWKSTLILAITGGIITVAAVFLFKKEEFIHGDLPGYEK